MRVLHVTGSKAQDRMVDQATREPLLFPETQTFGHIHIQPFSLT
jgi:hypothetical protein